MISTQKWAGFYDEMDWFHVYIPKGAEEAAHIHGFGIDRQRERLAIQNRVTTCSRLESYILGHIYARARYAIKLYTLLYISATYLYRTGELRSRCLSQGNLGSLPMD